jgi:hypothetical protein
MTTEYRAGRDQALAFRLERHRLSRRAPLDDLLEVVGACGIRNTPPGSAMLALHARIADLPPAAVERALAEDKTLVEALAMRASPHIVPARDLAIFTLGALPADDQSFRTASAALAKNLDQAGMAGGAALEQAADVACQALADGMLTRSDLSSAMTRRLPEALTPWCAACKVQHVNEILFRLVGVRGVWVVAPRGGKSGMYVRTDQWLGARPDGDRDAARAELLRRYLRCYGPSTAAHFAAWVGIASAEAGRVWERLADELVAVDLEGRRAWLLAADLPRLEHPANAAGVRLLPPYDSYLDQRDREMLLDAALHKRVWRIIGNPGAVLADGALVGVWRPQKKGKRLAISVEPFAALSAATRAEIEAEAALLAPYRGCTSSQVSFAT